MHFSSPFQQKCKTVKYLFSLWGSRSLRDRQSQFPFNTPLPIVFIYTNYRPISNPNPQKISIIDIPKCKNTHISKPKQTLIYVKYIAQDIHLYFHIKNKMQDEYMTQIISQVHQHCIYHEQSNMMGLNLKCTWPTIVPLCGF